MNSRRLISALLIAALIYGVSFYLLHGTAEAPIFPVSTQGHLVQEGYYPDERRALAQTPRTWGSRSGDDANEGTLRIGPFPAPARLRLAVSGYPHSRGNDLYLEMADLNLRLPLPVGEIGERWQVEEYEIPFGWRGRRVTVVAVDAGRGEGGWLAVSEPLPLASGRVFEFTFLAMLGAWICNGLFLGLCFLGAARWINGKAWVAAHWVPLVAGAAVALLGYAAFWIYFAQPLAGRWFSLSCVGSCVARFGVEAGSSNEPRA
ncbi:MAG: hypothetical protein H7343_16080 [Undibacterium sp.]|nr:hypothetical protein [Opitutaceae bacterium]